MYSLYNFIKNKTRKKPNKNKDKGPKLTPLQLQVKNLDIVIIHRLTCGNCKAVLREVTDNNLIDVVKLVNIDTEDWRMYYSYLPFTSLSLPIIISLKTKKISLGYITLENLLVKLT